MKKNLCVGLATLALAVGALAACSKGGNEETKTISSVQLKGVYTAYTTDDTIDWSKVGILVNYSDKSAVTISTADIEFDVETPASATTKAVLHTSGLHDLTVLKEKDYAMSVTLVSEHKDYSAGSITVGDITPDNYELLSFAKPSFISVYETTKANAGKVDPTDPAKTESYFKKGDDIFTVGNLNEFKFIPTVTFKRKNAGIETMKISNSYKKTVTVEEKSGESYQTASTADYSVVKEGVKFTSSASGKQFRLTVKPEQFTVSNPATFEFKVADGLNIYSAKELGATNLTKFTPADNAGNAYYENVYTLRDGVNISRGENAVFPNASKTGYERGDTFKMWRDFLINSGTFTSDEASAYDDAPGYFFMDNITVKPEDLPGEFFFKEGESACTEYNKDCLRDDINLYKILPSVAKTINGNYFNVDTTNIPLCMSSSNRSGIRSIYPTDKTVDPGHSNVFYVPGIGHETGQDDYMQGNTFDEKAKPVVFKNINTIGNTGTDLGHTPFAPGTDENFKKMAKLTGLIAFKAGAVPCQFNNIIVKQYMIGVFANSSLATYQGAAATQLNDSRIYDCANSGTFNYECQNFLVKNTELKRFGGAAIFNACSDNKAYYGGYTNLTKDCVIENKVTGEEVYFTAVGASGQIASLKALNTFFKAPFAEAPFVKKDEQGTEYMNVISLTMGDGYMGCEKRAFFGGTSLNCDEGTPTIIDLGNKSGDNKGGQIYNMVPTLLGTYAPVFTVDGEMTINHPLAGETPISGADAAGLLVFNPNNPLSPDPVIPAGVLDKAYGPGAYIPISTDPSKPVTTLLNTLEYKASNLHLVVPAAETSLNLIFGL